MVLVSIVETFLIFKDSNHHINTNRSIVSSGCIDKVFNQHFDTDDI